MVLVPHLRNGAQHKDAHWCSVFEELGDHRRRTAESWILELFAADWQLLSHLYKPRLNAYCNGSSPIGRDAASGPRCDMRAEPPMISLRGPGYCAQATDALVCQEHFVPFNRCAPLRRHNRTDIFIHVPKTGGTSIAAALDPSSKWPMVCHTTLDQRIAAGHSFGLSDVLLASVRNPFARAVASHGFWWKEVSFYEFVRLLRSFKHGWPEPLLDTPDQTTGDPGAKKMGLSMPQAYWLLPHSTKNIPPRPLQVHLVRTEELECDFQRLRQRLLKSGQPGREERTAAGPAALAALSHGLTLSRVRRTGRCTPKLGTQCFGLA